MDFTTYAKQRYQIALHRKEKAIQRHQDFLANDRTFGAVEESDRLAYAMAEEVLWAFLHKGGLDHGLREGGHWLTSTARHSGTANRMVQEVKREVALDTIKEVLGYVTEEQLRYFVGGISAKAYGEV